MMSHSGMAQVQTVPGKASAEEGLVVLDGPDGVAVTMTTDAAIATGHSLLAAAEIAAAYDPDTDGASLEDSISSE